MCFPSRTGSSFFPPRIQALFVKESLGLRLFLDYMAIDAYACTTLLFAGVSITFITGSLQQNIPISQSCHFSLSTFLYCACALINHVRYDVEHGTFVQEAEFASVSEARQAREQRREVLGKVSGKINEILNSGNVYYYCTN